jgi:uncharacterized protein YceK
MVKAFSVVLLLALVGCSGVPTRQHAASPCSVAEASTACQVERYNNAP